VLNHNGIFFLKTISFILTPLIVFHEQLRLLSFKLFLSGILSGRFLTQEVNMKLLFNSICLLQMIPIIANAQCYPQPQIKGPASTDLLKNNRLERPMPVSYPTVREADVMWSKRIWRVIDLREKLNQPMYYPVEPKVGSASLFDVLKCALLEKELTAYSNPAFDDEFTTPMTKNEIVSTLVSWDSTHQSEDINNPGVFISTPLKKEITAANIHQYWIKEDWFFDKQRSVMEVRITGICPLAEKLSETGEVVGLRPLFWIYFPDARKYLVNAAVFNRWNDHERMNYDELFEKRMFSSFIYKESNVYDRTIAQYKAGTDALLESEEINEEIFKYESNFWQH
jgi:gliding motility associated protien GldN